MGRQRKIPLEFKPEFDALKNAIHRCHNEDHIAYPSYGGRGISVQDALRAQDGWKLLIHAIGPRPDSSHSLDRIDNDANYTIDPPNLRWTDRKTQQNNRRKGKARNRDFGWGFKGRGKSPLIMHDGRLQTIKEWAEELGMKRATIRSRLLRGLTPAQALNPSTSRAGARYTIKPELYKPTIH